MVLALVTGAGIRIGRGIALGLAKQGYDLILHAHASQKELMEVSLEIEGLGQKVHRVTGDFSETKGQEDFCKQVYRITKQVDLLVHNAAIYEKRPFTRIDREQFRRMLSINLEAPYFITQELLPLIQNSSQKCVTYILDAMWERPYPQYSHYAASKAALAILTRALALELAPVRINAVSPGVIVFREGFDISAQDRVLKSVPLGRTGSIQDLVNALIFLAQAPYVTGQIVTVDGGRSIAPAGFTTKV